MVFGLPIAIIAAVVLRLTAGAAPRLRYLFTLTAFVAAAAIPFALALTQSEQRSELQLQAYADARAGNLPTPNRGDAVSLQAQPRGTEPKTTGVESDINSTWDSLRALLYKPTTAIGIMSLWILGACLLCIREVMAHFSVALARRKFIKADPKLLLRMVWPKKVSLYVDDHCGPYALGITNSIVVIPAKLFAELREEALSQVARHELDHLKWRDPMVNAAMRLVLALLWPSVPLWYLNRMAKLEREAAADRAALEAEGSELRSDTAAADYASALVAIGRNYSGKNMRQTYALVASEIGDQRGFNERVRRLLTVSSPPTAPRIIFATATLLAGVSFITLLPIASVRSKAKTSDDEFLHAQLEPAHAEALIDARRDRIKVVSAPANRSPGQRRLADQTEQSLQGASIEIKDSNANTTDAAVEIRPSSISTDTHDEFEDQMAAVGYTNLSPDQISRMRQYAVGPAYVSEMAKLGYGDLDADMLITFKWLAVSGSYIEEMKSLGYGKLSPRLLVNFRQTGVSSQYIKEMRSRLSGQITAEQLASLRLFGASPDFLDKLKALGYEKLNAGQVINMRLQGVTIAYVEQMQARLSRPVSADELISMRMRNIY